MQRVLDGVGRLKAILGAYALALPLQIAANLVLIPRWGAVGAAAATLAAHASLGLVLTAVVVASGVRFPVAAIGRHAAATAAMAGVVLLTRSLPILIPMAAGAACYAILLLVLSGSQSLERRLLVAALKRWRAH